MHAVGGGGGGIVFLSYHYSDSALSLDRQKPNLILNVDGVIAVSFVDLLRHCGAFSE